MGYSLNITQADAVLEKLRKDYRVFAPRRFPKQGRYSDTDIVRYAEVERFSDIVWDVKSDYPAKEVLTPIQQTIFYFTEDEYRASKVAAKTDSSSGKALRYQCAEDPGQDICGQRRL